MVLQELDIERAGRELEANINLTDDVTVVPMASSKAKNDPEYDDRILQIAQAMCEALKLMSKSFWSAEDPPKAQEFNGAQGSPKARYNLQV